MTTEPSMVVAMVKMALVLLLMVGGLAVVLYFLRSRLKLMPFKGQGHLVRVLSSHPLGLKKHISLVVIPGAVLVVGVTPDRIQLLDKISDPEVLARLTKGEDAEHGLSFSAILGKRL